MRHFARDYVNSIPYPLVYQATTWQPKVTQTFIKGAISSNWIGIWVNEVRGPLENAIWNSVSRTIFIGYRDHVK